MEVQFREIGQSRPEQFTSFECDLTAKPLKSPEEKKKSTISINLRRFRQSVNKKPNGHETIKNHKLLSVSKLSYHISARKRSNLKVQDHLANLNPNLNKWIKKRLSDLISSKAATCMTDGKAYSVEANVDVIFEATRYINDEIVSSVEVKEEEEEKKKSCAICFEELSGGVGCTEIQCSHTFHRDCIWSWLRKNMSCPYCRSCVCGVRSCDHGKAKSC